MIITVAILISLAYGILMLMMFRRDRARMRRRLLRARMDAMSASMRNLSLIMGQALLPAMQNATRALEEFAAAIRMESRG